MTKTNKAQFIDWMIGASFNRSNGYAKSISIAPTPKASKNGDISTDLLVFSDNSGHYDRTQ